jgi:hypothetical protein
MATTPDFLDSKRDEIAARLAELQPLVEEYQRLEAAAAALDTVLASANGATASATQQAATSGRKRGRPKGSGDRQAQALAMVRESPGITIPEIAERMDIKDNYLYRVLPRLAEDELIVKDGKGWYPKDAG